MRNININVHYQSWRHIREYQKEQYLCCQNVPSLMIEGGLTHATVVTPHFRHPSQSSNSSRSSRVFFNPGPHLPRYTLLARHVMVLRWRIRTKCICFGVTMS